MSALAQIDLSVREHAHGSFSAPFAPDYRAGGVLLHVTSLPSPYGIGDLGPCAYAWVDQLAAAGQSWWQVLPLGPTGYGHSPYQSLSSFAANPLVLSPDLLVEEDLLPATELSDGFFPQEYVDFERVIAFKRSLLARAWAEFPVRASPALRFEFEQFCDDKGPIQDRTALFMAIRAQFRGARCQDWPADLVRPTRRKLAALQAELADPINKFRFGQFLILRQWQRLKHYANERGVQILGDLPIFVSPDSADVWARPELFLVDEGLRPRVVAGVPPDYFSAEGQLWGNPLYNWEALRQDGYQWWIDRLAARLEYLDGIRIDHFRAFEAAWHVPADAATASSGQWVPGPGADFFQKTRAGLGGLPLLAEDLGVITPGVEALRDRFELPGMRVLQFAFNGDPNNSHLPHRCRHNGVVYTGTHDNDTTRGWYELQPDHVRGNFWKYVQRAPAPAEEAPWEMIRLAWKSGAALAIAPLQDLLGLGSEARMNTPGRGEGQWTWRCTADEETTGAAFQRLYELTTSTGRLSSAHNTISSGGYV